MPGQVETKFVRYEVKNRVAWVTLNRPEAMNALSTALLADLGTVFREMIPLSEALRIALTGSPISAERAYQIGIVQELAADRDEVMKIAQGIADEILLGAPLAMQDIKRLVKEGVEMTIPQAEMLREILFSHLAQTEDALEGPRAFAEKRLPNWKMR